MRIVRHILAAGIAALAFAAPALGQEIFPAKPIALVVPFPPGGVADIVPGRRRCDGPPPQRARGRREQIRRRRRIGMGYVAKAKPDGYNAADGAVVDLDHSRSRQGHRPGADVPAQSVRAGRALHRRSDRAGGALREPVEDAPGVRCRRAQAAGRDQLRLVGELRTMHIPMEMPRGERRPQVAPRSLHRRRTRSVALLGGTVDAISTGPSTVIQHVKAGKVRVLASWETGGLRRCPTSPR